MPIYMNWGDSAPPKIKGDVTEVFHVDWIELSSVHFGVLRGIAAPTDKSSQPAPSEIVIFKVTDSSSPHLIRESVQGEGTTVIIDFVKTDAGRPVVYQQWKLKNTLISAYSLSSGGDRPLESLSLNFTNLEWGTGQGLTPYTSTPPSARAGRP